MLLRPQQVAVNAVVILVALMPALAQDEVPTSRSEEIQQSRRQKSEKLEPETPGAVERAFLKLQALEYVQSLGRPGNGVFPKFGGLASGQGTGLGLLYSKADLAGGQIRFSGFGVASLSGSQRYGIDITAPYIANRRVAWNLAASRRTLTRVGFYGIGPDSSKEDRTSYLIEDTSLDTSFTYQPSSESFHMGVKGGYVHNNVGSGNADDFPSTEEIFSTARIPGLADQGSFIRFGGFATLDVRDNPALTRTGTLLRADFTNYHDQDLGRHDFNRLELEAQHYIPFFNQRRVIALRARTVMSFTDDGQSVPFFMKPWIGGPQELRGFRTYRFYDDNILVMNAEYRWEAFSGLDMAIFLDAGQADPKRQDFDIGEMESAAGVGFRFNIRNVTFLRLDFAFSHEAARVWFRWGDPF